MVAKARIAARNGAAGSGGAEGEGSYLHLTVNARSLRASDDVVIQELLYGAMRHSLYAGAVKAVALAITAGAL